MQLDFRSLLPASDNVQRTLRGRATSLSCFWLLLSLGSLGLYKAKDWRRIYSIDLSETLRLRRRACVDSTKQRPGPRNCFGIRMRMRGRSLGNEASRTRLCWLCTTTSVSALPPSTHPLLALRWPLYAVGVCINRMHHASALSGAHLSRRLTREISRACKEMAECEKGRGGGRVLLNWNTKV